ncbi:MAG: hypothetical protein J4F28_02640 [Nitrosopumilaceae archaeon]|nr:hypothetical protein [Nitrosopumilaceae archaeon]
MADGRFATSISCMDGRIQTVLNEWIRENHGVDYVDTITAPGVDGRVARNDDLGKIIQMARISVEKHGSRLIVVSGHHDCAGNPVSEEEHKGHIRSAVNVIRAWEEEHGLADASGNDGGGGNDNDTGGRIEVAGVWVGETWAAQRIA